MIKRLRSWIGPIVLVVIVAGVVWLVGGLLRQSQPLSGTVYTVQRNSISAVVRTTGHLEATRQMRLSFRTGDTLKQILVKPGDTVPTGTLLMSLDTAQLDKQLSQAQTQYDINTFNLSNQAVNAANNASSNDTPSSPYQLYSLADQAQAAATQLQSAKDALNNARLYAPFAGTVISVDANEGDGVQAGQEVVVLADLTRMQVRADIDEIDVANVATGQTVDFNLDAFPGQDFQGQVTSLSPAPSQRQGSTTYSAVVNFQHPTNLYLRPGMAANLTITSLSRNNVLVIPNRALATIGLEQYVTHVKADGSLEKIPVEVGLTNANNSEIISGLNEGDKIILPR